MTINAEMQGQRVSLTHAARTGSEFIASMSIDEARKLHGELGSIVASDDPVETIPDDDKPSYMLARDAREFFAAFPPDEAGLVSGAYNTITLQQAMIDWFANRGAKLPVIFMGDAESGQRSVTVEKFRRDAHPDGSEELHLITSVMGIFDIPEEVTFHLITSKREDFA